MEPLVVIGIITILASMVLGFAALAQERSGRTSCMNNLRQMTLVFQMYCDENEGDYPPTLLSLAPDYVTEKRILICPASNDPAGTSFDDVKEWSSYEYRDNYKPAMGSVLLRENKPNHWGRRMVLMNSGETKAVSGSGY